jgi:hexokinase
MPFPTGPEKKYGTKIANLLRAFAKEVQVESKANGVKISCTFVYWADKAGKAGGELKMVTHVTPDAVTERLDGALKLRGNKLQLDVDHALQAQINKMRGKI